MIIEYGKVEDGGPWGDPGRRAIWCWDTERKRAWWKFLGTGTTEVSNFTPESSFIRRNAKPFDPVWNELHVSEGL